jgi:hypothetical protein
VLRRCAPCARRPERPSVAVVANDRKLRDRIWLTNQILELPVEQFEPPGNLLAAFKPALLPVIKLLFDRRIDFARLIEVAAQTQQRLPDARTSWAPCIDRIAATSKHVMIQEDNDGLGPHFPSAQSKNRPGAL